MLGVEVPISRILHVGQQPRDKGSEVYAAGGGRCALVAGMHQAACGGDWRFSSISGGVSTWIVSVYGEIEQYINIRWAITSVTQT